MQNIMVDRAQWHRKGIADFQRKATALRKTDVMGM